MESNNTHYFYNNLNQNFENNIKFSFITFNSIIIITNEDKCYEFSRNAINNSLLIFSNNKSIIEQKINESFVEELSYKGIIEFKNSLSHTMGRTVDGKLYCWGKNWNGVLGNGRSDKRYNKSFYDEEVNEYLIDGWGYNSYGVLGNGRSDGNRYGVLGNGRSDGTFNKPEVNEYLIDKHIIEMSCGAYSSFTRLNK